jgi:beta-galactosidase
MFTRGIYATDKLRNWMSAYDDVYQEQPQTLANRMGWLNVYRSRPWLAGGFAWTGFDYRGEPSPYAWPSISSQYGIVDTCGFPKDAYYHYKLFWNSEPLLHLLPHWNWPGRDGEEILVQVESNLDSVELFLNGKSLGSQNVLPLFHLEWKVNYTPGVLEARGTKDGKVVLTKAHRTAGPPAQIVLTADRNELLANGEDVAVIRVEAFDNNGYHVPTADALIQFKVSGEGTLIGVGNGDPNCLESDKGSERSLFNGLAQLIVQTTKNPGSLLIDAAARDLESGHLTVVSQKAKFRPFVA